jgi:hypothetical protein
VKHADAWQLLPDLLDSLDDDAVIRHVRECTDCQRQLFLLGRVDRLLRVEAQTRRGSRFGRRIASSAAALAVAAAVLLALVLPGGSHTRAFTLRTATGALVGRAAVVHADARNDALSLIASGLPLNRQHMFALWAGDGAVSMRVGEFMVDSKGGCRVRFNLPAAHRWNRFWVSQPEDATAVVAAT